MWKLSHPFSTRFSGGFFCRPRPSLSSTRPKERVTFDHVAVNRAFEVLAGLLVEVLAVNDPHLFEESRLAALASAQQQDLHQPLHVRLLPGEAFVDLLGLARLFHLAAAQQADGQANFQHGPGRQEIRHVRTNFIDANFLVRVRGVARDQAPALKTQEVPPAHNPCSTFYLQTLRGRGDAIF